MDRLIKLAELLDSMNVDTAALTPEQLTRMFNFATTTFARQMTAALVYTALVTATVSDQQNQEKQAIKPRAKRARNRSPVTRPLTTKPRKRASGRKQTKSVTRTDMTEQQLRDGGARWIRLEEDLQEISFVSVSGPSGLERTGTLAVWPEISAVLLRTSAIAFIPDLPFLYNQLKLRLVPRTVLCVYLDSKDGEKDYALLSELQSYLELRVMDHIILSGTTQATATIAVVLSFPRPSLCDWDNSGELKVSNTDINAAVLSRLPSSAFAIEIGAVSDSFALAAKSSNVSVLLAFYSDSLLQASVASFRAFAV